MCLDVQKADQYARACLKQGNTAVSKITKNNTRARQRTSKAICYLYVLNIAHKEVEQAFDSRKRRRRKQNGYWGGMRKNSIRWIELNIKYRIVG